ncbi:MAG: FadR/GntR family transcriptional regulator, partial [Candidatus Asgardarchaeum sp.]
IIDGNLKPGDKLPPERELAEKFHVGRTTIREALKALSYAKIIIRTREGTIINRNVLDYFTDSLNEKLICKYVDLEDLIEARKVIELETASLAAQRATIEDINILQKNLLNMKKFVAKNNVSEYIDTNVEFHETIAEAAQNRVLYEILTAVRGLLKESQETIVKHPGIMNRSLEYHEKIFKAIKERNAFRAKEEMFAHLDDVEKTLISLEKK